MHKMLMLSSIAAILAGVALTFYFKSQESQVIESTYAYVSEAPIEIKALQPGKITFIAQHGQPVKKGELLLQTDAQLAISARQTAERSLAELEAGLHPYTIQIFNRLTRIPESATEITQELQLTRELHRQAGQLATSTSIRHASTQLELRKLELKQNRIA